jgi:integrase
VLTDKAIQRLKPRDKLYRVADRDGLCLEIAPSGSKLWRFRYRVDGVEKMMSLRATYPGTTLLAARDLRDNQRAILRGGVDPSLKRKRDKLLGATATANTFEAVALEWLTKQSHEWVPEHETKVRVWLKHHVFPVIGSAPIADIDAPQVLALLRRLVTRGTLNTAGRIRQTLSAVWRYAIATGRASHDPAAALRDALPRAQGTNFATITEPKAIGELLRAIDGYQGSPVTFAALKLAPLLFQRPGELRAMQWAEVDLDAAEWRIPAARQKIRKAKKENPRTPPHIVPLSDHVVAILRELHSITKHSAYVFPSTRDPRRPMSENTINAALRRLGYTTEQVTGHGFRHMASTRLNELGWNPDAIERQLAHRDRDEIRGTYNLATYLDERKKMMAAWADYLDGLRAGADVVTLKRTA